MAFIMNGAKVKTFFFGTEEQFIYFRIRRCAKAIRLSWRFKQIELKFNQTFTQKKASTVSSWRQMSFCTFRGLISVLWVNLNGTRVTFGSFVCANVAITVQGLLIYENSSDKVL